MLPGHCSFWECQLLNRKKNKDNFSHDVDSLTWSQYAQDHKLNNWPSCHQPHILNIKTKLLHHMK